MVLFGSKFVCFDLMSPLTAGTAAVMMVNIHQINSRREN